VARLPIGDSFLELVQPVEESGRFFEQVQERGEGLFSISVRSRTSTTLSLYLRGKDIKVSDPDPASGRRSASPRINHEYTHGVSIQLIERK
jgi:hypothetical protein